MAKQINQENKNGKRTVDIDPIWSRFSQSGQGHFEAFVRLSEGYRPDYMKIMGPFIQGLFKAELPASALPRVARDENVLGFEVREYRGN